MLVLRQAIALVLVVAVVVIGTPAASVAQEPMVQVFSDGFAALDSAAWGVTHVSSAGSYAPAYGTAFADGGFLRLRPSQTRGGDVLWSREGIVTDLPAHLSMRVRFPGNTSRSVRLYLMAQSPVSDDGTKWTNPTAPRVHLTLGTTRWPSYPSLYVYTARGRTGGQYSSTRTLPSDTYVDVDVWLYEDRLTCTFAGTTMQTIGDVRSLLDATGSLKLTFAQLSDEERNGVDVDVVAVEQVPRIVNVPPVASAGEDRSAYVSEVVKFDGAGSSDSDGQIVSYEWDFGDGTNGSGVTVVHSYAAPGDYDVTLAVTDDDGASSADFVRVHVASPLEGLLGLRDRVASATLSNPAGNTPRGYRAALLHKLDRAISACRDGDVAAMERALRTFTAQLTPRQVPSTTLDEWAEDVRRIVAAARSGG